MFHSRDSRRVKITIHRAGNKKEFIYLAILLIISIAIYITFLNTSELQRY